MKAFRHMAMACSALMELASVGLASAAIYGAASAADGIDPAEGTGIAPAHGEAHTSVGEELAAKDREAMRRRNGGVWEGRRDRALAEAEPMLRLAAVHAWASEGGRDSEFSGALVSERVILTTSHGACPRGQASVGRRIAVNVGGMGETEAVVAVCGLGRPRDGEENLGKAARDWAVAVLGKAVPGAKPIPIGRASYGDMCVWAGWQAREGFEDAAETGSVEIAAKAEGTDAETQPAVLMTAPFPTRSGYSGGPVACLTKDGLRIAGDIAGHTASVGFAAGYSRAMAEAVAYAESIAKGDGN